MKLPVVDRRKLLIGGGAGLGLVIGYLAWPRDDSTPLRAGDRDRLINLYLRIGTDGRVTLAVPQAEVGQGIWTGLAQVAADELGAAWTMMAVEPAPSDPAYSNALLAAQFGGPLRITALGTSVRAFETPVRHAAAMARALLCEAAAEQWGVKASECRTENGMAVHEGRTLGFGALAEAAAHLPTPGDVELLDAGAGKLVGEDLQRLDLPPKSDGAWRFAGDVRLPGMMFASVRIAPPQGRLEGMGAAPDNAVRIVKRDRWVGAVGASWWAADKALRAMNPVFSGPAEVTSPAISERLAQLIEGGVYDRQFDTGDYDTTADGARPLAATYGIAPLPHYSLEPTAVAARFANGGLEIWAASRVPDLARAAAAKAASLPDDRVTLYAMPIGDGSGTGFDVEAITIAVELAREVGRPVSLTLPPQVTQNQDACRPPQRIKIAALMDPDGAIKSWHATIAGMAGLGADVARAKGDKAASFEPKRAVPPYSIPAIRVDSASADLPIKTGYWRGDEAVMATFAAESFMDELARLMRQEPLAFRVSMLGGSPRLAKVLTTAATLGGWDGGASGSSMGLAAASLQGSHIALLAEAAVGPDQRPQVSRLVAAVDCGRVVNPALVRQQVEGGLLAGLAAACVDAPEYIVGMPRARPMSGQPFERLGHVPSITIELIESGAERGGISGLGVAVIAPAVANAIAAGSGRRLRNLPFDSMAG